MTNNVVSIEPRLADKQLTSLLEKLPAAGEYTDQEEGITTLIVRPDDYFVIDNAQSFGKITGAGWNPHLTPDEIAEYKVSLSLFLSWINQAVEQDRPIIEVIKQERAGFYLPEREPCDGWEMLGDGYFRYECEGDVAEYEAILRAPCPSGSVIYVMEHGFTAEVKDDKAEIYWFD